MLDVELFELNAGLHHAVNLFWHITNVLLLFLVMRTMTGSLWRSAMVAVLFAVHPLHVETVAWVSERKDLLSTFFGLLAVYCYLNNITRERTLLWYGLLIICFTLSLLAKPMWVTLPFLLLGLDFWPLQKLRAKTKTVSALVLEKLPLIAIVIVSSVVTFLAQRAGGAVDTLERTSLFLRLANSAVAYVTYIFKHLVPINLGIFYPLPTTIPHWQMAGAIILLMALTGGVILSRKKHPYLITGWLWYLGTLIPVIGIVQVGSQSMADRYTYLPSIGLLIIFVWGTYELFGKLKLKPLYCYLFSGAIIVLLGSLTWLQVQHWQNSITLFEHTLSITKNNSVAHINLGSAYGTEKDFAKAIFHLKSAIVIKPNDPLALYNLGLVYQNAGNIAEAISYYKQATQAKPNYPEAFNNLGNCYQAQNNLPQAITSYETAIKLKPNYPEAYNNLGTAYAISGNMNKAIEQFHLALKYRPNYKSAWQNLRKAKSFSINLNRNLAHTC